LSKSVGGDQNFTSCS